MCRERHGGSDREQRIGRRERVSVAKGCELVGTNPLQRGACAAPLSQPFTFTVRVGGHETYYDGTGLSAHRSGDARAAGMWCHAHRAAVGGASAAVHARSPDFAGLSALLDIVAM